MKDCPALMNEIDDQTLVRQSREGSREAFGKLVDRHHQVVRSMLWRVVGNTADVDDIAQEVFLAALNSVASFQEQSSFRTWLLAVARNKAVSHLRKRKKSPSLQFDPVDRAITDHQMALALYDQTGSFQLDALRDCLGELEQKQRQLIEQVYFDGRRAKEIAQESGQAQNAIRMRLMRIRRALSTCIKNKIVTS